MLGLMQDGPLLISSLIEFAAKNHGDEEIVSRTVEGPIHRYTYKDCNSRMGKYLLSGIQLSFEVYRFKIEKNFIG